MVAYLDVGMIGFNDGLFYDPAAAEADQIKSVFRQIFELLHQEQNYDRMMSTVTGNASAC